MSRIPATIRYAFRRRLLLMKPCLMDGLCLGGVSVVYRVMPLDTSWDNGNNTSRRFVAMMCQLPFFLGNCPSSKVTRRLFKVVGDDWKRKHSQAAILIRLQIKQKRWGCLSRSSDKRRVGRPIKLRIYNVVDDLNKWMWFLDSNNTSFDHKWVEVICDEGVSVYRMGGKYNTLQWLYSIY